MQINVSARHGNLAADTQSHIEKKVARLPRLFDRLTAVEVMVDLEHLESPKVELCVSAEHHDDFVAADEGVNVLAAFDSALAKMESQLRRHKEKITGHRATGHKHLDATLPPDEEAS